MKKQPAEWHFDDIKIGYKTEQIPCLFSTENIDAFAKLSGDYNPLHIDDTFAGYKGYKGRVVHGMLLASKFSYLVGMIIPGKNCLYLSQEIRFHKPVIAGDKCNVTGTIISKSKSTRVIEIKTEIIGPDGSIAASGTANVKII
jgi:acyl dehydratase